MLEVFDIIQTPHAAISVAELDRSLTPPGLALELHLAVLGAETIAFWLLEDGRVLSRVRIGEA